MTFPLPLICKCNGLYWLMATPKHPCILRTNSIQQMYFSITTLLNTQQWYLEITHYAHKESRSLVLFLWLFFKRTYLISFKTHQEISISEIRYLNSKCSWLECSWVEMKTDRSWVDNHGGWMMGTPGPSYYSLYFCTSDSSHNKKVKMDEINNPSYLPFLVLVLGETPQQILLPAGKLVPVLGYL